MRAITNMKTLKFSTKVVRVANTNVFRGDTIVAGVKLILADKISQIKKVDDISQETETNELVMSVGEFFANIHEVFPELIAVRDGLAEAQMLASKRGDFVKGFSTALLSSFLSDADIDISVQIAEAKGDEITFRDGTIHAYSYVGDYTTIDRLELAEGETRQSKYAVAGAMPDGTGDKLFIPYYQKYGVGR